MSQPQSQRGAAAPGGQEQAAAALTSEDEIWRRLSEKLVLQDVQAPENEGKGESIPSAEENRNKQGAEDNRESEESSDEKKKGDSGEKGAEASVDKANTEDTPFDSFYQNTSKMGEDVLEAFIKTGLHRYKGSSSKWPVSTIVVCSIRYLNDAGNVRHTVFMIQNTPQGHAEKILIDDHIKKKINVTKVQHITIYCNYSPCNEPRHTCSTELLTLQNELPEGVCLKVKFTSFYNILRPSCSKCCKKASEEKSSESFAKLQALDAMPFQEEDWKDFIRLLQNIDQYMNRPAKDLLKIRYGDQYGVWRDWEDRKMINDFKELNKASKFKNMESTPKKPQSTSEPFRPIKDNQATDRTTDGRGRRNLSQAFKQLP